MAELPPSDVSLLAPDGSALAPDVSAPEAAVAALTDFLARHERVCVLTGAGCSTESGIPDYRGPQTRHTPRNPIRFHEFTRQPAIRRRYWARSFLGWPRIAGARPNPGHVALGALEAAGPVRHVITQNVDGLHHAGGSSAVTELHGALREVVCLHCGAVTDRDAMQRRLRELNPTLAALADRGVPIAPGTAPDGDVDLDGEAVRRFRYPACTACSGVLKPHVVFFGENVPRPRVEACYAEVDAADALLVLGSSLTVFSGYRFVLRAAKAGRPVAIANLGPTRGDEHASLRIEGPVGALLPAVVARLASTDRTDRG